MELRRQRDELAELNAERQRLLAMQQHLLKLQESVAAATSAATTQVSSLPRSDRLQGRSGNVGEFDICRETEKELTEDREVSGKTSVLATIQYYFIEKSVRTQLEHN